MGIDNHLNMSITSGLISNFHGASNFINDQPDPRQAAYTVHIQAKLREEHLDLETLVSQQVPRLVGEKGVEESELDPTHIVTSVCYGGEAYCVFVQDVDGGEADEEARQEIIQQLSKIGMEWQDALHDFKDLDQFKQQLDSQQKHQVTRIKCRLYADFQVEPVVECNFFDAYKQSLQLMKTMYRKETGNSKAIPIAIRLCPLKCLVDPIERNDKKFGYRDIDDGLITRYSELQTGDSSKLFGCSYSVYEGDTLLKSSLRRLPGPPSGLQVQHPVSRKAKKAKTSLSSVCLFWDYEILGLK